MVAMRATCDDIKVLVHSGTFGTCGVSRVQNDGCVVYPLTTRAVDGSPADRDASVAFRLVIATTQSFSLAHCDRSRLQAFASYILEVGTAPEAT